MGVNAFWLMLGALGVYAVFYRYYSGFLAARVVELDDRRPTPAHVRGDRRDYHATNGWVLWGHHFAAISGAGPLIGPVLAAQFGYLPGLLWLVFGVCLAGAVQDFIILTASMRRGGRSLAQIAREEISATSGAVAMLASVFVLIVGIAVLGFVVVKALAESPWGTFTIGASIPIALLMGLSLHRFRKGRVAEASAVGVVLLLAAVLAGGLFQPGHVWSSHAGLFTLSETGLTAAIAVYGLFASILPVWMLLCPRDYLSAYMKIGTIAVIVVSVFLVRPVIQAPAISRFAGGGPVVAGPLFPFLFITIACGAISGVHSLISSGTTPKMIDRETHARPIGYGAMLMESLVGVTALIAACSLAPADYFAINMKPAAFAALTKATDLGAGRLSELTSLVGESRLAGRTGGGVSLAVGITQIFGNLPWIGPLLGYIYHFVIMFEALFILTAIDTGTRIARFLLQELVSSVMGRTAATSGMVSTILASTVVVGGWSTFIFTGSILTLWPMFGVANQLLAIVALAIGTTVLVNEGKSRYALVTLVPMVFLGFTTLWGGALSIKMIFLPMIARPGAPADAWKGALDSVLTAVMMACVAVVVLDSVPRWRRHWRGGREETLRRIEPCGAA